MPRTPKKDLQQFRRWLTVEKGLSDSTVTNYTSNVRRILGDLQQRITPEELTHWFDSIENRKLASVYRSSWRRFVEYGKSHGLNIPDEDRTKSLYESQFRYALPDEIISALRTIVRSSGLKPADLSRIRWSDIRRKPHDGAWLVKDPRQPGFVRMPIQATIRVENWAQPTGPDDPLVPRVPGHTSAIPGPAVRRILGRRTK